MLASILLLPLVLPQTEAPPTPRERLEALIESTNELEHFSVEYALQGKKGVGKLWVEYLAPRSIRLRMETPAGEMRCGCANDVLWMHSSSSEGREEMRVDLLDRGGDCEDAIAVLRGNSWYPSEGPEVWFELSLSIDPKSGMLTPRLSFFHATVGSESHVRLLPWLHSIEHMEGELTVEGEEVVHRITGAEARIDIESGFLNRLVFTSPDGVERGIELVSIDLDTPPESDRFLPPQSDPTAVDTSEDSRNSMLSRYQVRLTALRYVHGKLEGAERHFDDELHDELESFFIALYDSKITGDLEDWIQRQQEYAIKYADWIRLELQSGRPLEELETAASVRRGELDAGMQLMRAKVTTLPPADPERYADSDHWRAIRDLENEVLLARYDVLIVRPILDNFDARVDEALDR
jgi:hypothetical protein